MQYLLHTLPPLLHAGMVLKDETGHKSSDSFPSTLSPSTGVLHQQGAGLTVNGEVHLLDVGPGVVEISGVHSVYAYRLSSLHKT